MAYLGNYHLVYFHWKAGNTNTSIEYMERSIELQGNFLPAHSPLLMDLSLDQSGTVRSYKAAAELFDTWHDIGDLDDDAASDLVHANQIDIPIDLIGQTGDGNLAVFARKPAPVQASWLGYWARTGLRELEYVIADPVCVPSESTYWFSENFVPFPTT